MKSTKIWSWWMTCLGFGVAVGGLFLAVFVPAFFPGIQDLFYRSFQPGPLAATVSGPDLRHIQWLYGVLGGVMVGWGLSLGLMGYRTFRDPSPWIWNTILVSIVSWFVIDTALSVTYGVVPNVVLNIGIVILGTIPAVLGKRAGARLATDKT